MYMKCSVRLSLCPAIYFWLANCDVNEVHAQIYNVFADNTALAPTVTKFAQSLKFSVTQCWLTALKSHFAYTLTQKNQSGAAADCSSACCIVAKAFAGFRMRSW